MICPLPWPGRVVPAGFIVGASAGSTDEAAAAVGADYWGVGPWRTTDTSGRGCGPRHGGVRSDRAALGREALHRRGGYAEDVGAVLAAGGAGVAVVSGILGEDDIEAAARRYGQR